MGGLRQMIANDEASAALGHKALDRCGEGLMRHRIDGPVLHDCDRRIMNRVVTAFPVLLRSHGPPLEDNSSCDDSLTTLAPLIRSLAAAGGSRAVERPPRNVT